MSAIATETQTGSEFDELKTRLKSTWMSGNYDLFSSFMEKDAEQFYQRLGVKPGTRLLDVGCGAGQLAHFERCKRPRHRTIVGAENT